jgi:hypothetical protein
MKVPTQVRTYLDADLQINSESISIYIALVVSEHDDDQVTYGYTGWESKDSTYRDSSVKSKVALQREGEAKAKFDYVRDQTELALYKNLVTMIGLAFGRLDLPHVLTAVLEYAGYRQEMVVNADGLRRAVAGRRICFGTDSIAGYGPAHKNYSRLDLNLSDMNSFRRGEKIVIPLTEPDFHLTNSCYLGESHHISIEYRNFQCCINHRFEHI